MQIGMTKQMEWQTKWNGKQSGMANKVEWQTKWNGKQSGMANKVERRTRRNAKSKRNDRAREMRGGRLEWGCGSEG